ncbi:hypothetical protein GCM10007415_09680 [Parapedobacter pyrenivorans]|uniref:Uncharacterized protein n=1 Tax=Parapedobacter pyrenivorans TaxID=1305674 RepID=A0A917HI02_9SPHI|nr:hypothetical protein [Parapedobacter pyrenivorans]GGG79527.1 hypothetical protein GCM10007415_09680 [Parapedobacter pyrenivorans]
MPTVPLGNWTFWAEYRASDNLQAVYWLYNLTGQPFLLDLGKLLHKQGFDFVDMFLHRDGLTRFNSIHCVNLAQGIKAPVIYYQQQPEQRFLDAVKKAFPTSGNITGNPRGCTAAMKGCMAVTQRRGLSFALRWS